MVHSATKYLDGCGSTLLGTIIGARRFDFADQAVAARFPDFDQPDDSYHGVVYAQDFRVGGALGADLTPILKTRAEGLRDLGLTASPFAVWAMGLRVDALSLRVTRHVENARTMAEHLQFLVGGGMVQTVRWSSLPSSPYYQLAQKYTPEGAGAVLNFDLTGGLGADKRFTDPLELLASVASIGDMRSSAIRPVSTTHSQLSGAELVAQGISAETVWISVGIENSQDIIADIDRSLAAAKVV